MWVDSPDHVQTITIFYECSEVIEVDDVTQKKETKTCSVTMGHLRSFVEEKKQEIVMNIKHKIIRIYLCSS